MMEKSLRDALGVVLNYLANQIEDDKRRWLQSMKESHPILDEHYWLGRQTAHEDTARQIENRFSISRMEFYTQ